MSMCFVLSRPNPNYDTVVRLFEGIKGRAETNEDLFGKAQAIRLFAQYAITQKRFDEAYNVLIDQECQALFLKLVAISLQIFIFVIQVLTF